MWNAFDLWQYRKLKPYIDAYEEARTAYCLARGFVSDEELREYLDEMEAAENALERAEERYDEFAYWDEL